MNFFNLSFLDPIRSLRCNHLAWMTGHLNFTVDIPFSLFYWKLQSIDQGYNITCQSSICFERENLVILSLFFFTINIPFAFLSQFWVFSNKRWCYSACKMPIVMVSTMGRQYKKTFNPISNSWPIFKISKLRFPHYIVLFVVLFTADTKEKLKKKMGRAQ